MTIAPSAVRSGMHVQNTPSKSHGPRKKERHVVVKYIIDR
jgi:hypothetical protein